MTTHTTKDKEPINPYEVIQRSLSPLNCAEDKALFQQYVTGKITLDECYEKFIYSNHIKYEDLDEFTFRNWLASIGWTRKKNNNYI